MGQALPIVVCTCWQPRAPPTHLSALYPCLQSSLKRLQREQLGLYMIHWPGFFGPNYFSNDAFINGLGDCLDEGLCKAVGVSNFNAKRVQKASKILEVRPALVLVLWFWH